ncbi:MAG: hypothetical protein J5582_02645 [Ruminococcus sp.]|uniref:helix-turn-helix domain-containing protein n=1 Tax=Ruminococcus sp. TaxID=41978 RepID=UPI0025D5BF6F|nr:helix-turn-helix domain-containing protein [Ruminococcus sp.]MBO4865458.1 hypothetical protein [Ruminococcus sp.]
MSAKKSKKNKTTASSVCRVNKNANYTVMSNYHLRSTNLSLKAIGLLSKVLSLPENWDYSISGLTDICKEKETAIKAALDELKHCGYLVVTKLMPNETNSGRIEYTYNDSVTSVVDKYKLSEQLKDVNERISALDDKIMKLARPETHYEEQTNDQLDASMRAIAGAIEEQAAEPPRKRGQQNVTIQKARKRLSC